MKRFIVILSVFTITVCATMTICSAMTYDVINLSDNNGTDRSARINDNGDVVWENDSNIYLYNGSTTTKISTGSSHGYSPDINNNGTVVWYFSSYSEGNRFYVYDGFNITRLDDPYGIDSPQINEQGQFAWIASDGSDYELYMYDGMDIVQITDNAYDETACDINDNGVVVWSGGDGSDDEIYIYDGTGITQVTDNFNHDVIPRINNSGQIVWNRDDSVTWHYFLYDGVSTVQLSTTDYLSWGGDINDHGMAVWYGADVYQDNKIFIYDGNTTTVLSNPPYNVDVHDLQINNRGQVVWSASDGGDDEIFLYDGSAIIQLTDNDYEDLGPQINDQGHVTWRGEAGDWEVFLAVPNRAEMMGDIISFYNQGIENKTIEVKVPRSIRNLAQEEGSRKRITRYKKRKIEAMRKLLETAQQLIDEGFDTSVCGVLEATYTRCDGHGVSPRDWFKPKGDTPELASMIHNLLLEFRCQTYE